MKYLFVIPALNAGGAERVIVTLANKLSSLNNEITILTLNDSSSFYEINSNVEVIGLNVSITKNRFLRLITVPFKETQRILKMKSVIKKSSPDIIISFLFTTNIFSIILSIFNKIPLVVSERNDPNAYSFLKKNACKYLYPMSNAIVCQGEKVSSFFNKGNPNIHIIPNPIDKKSIPTVIPNQRKKKIVGVGRLIKQKNFELLIDGFFQISKKFPDHSLEIYGHGPLKKNLLTQINNLGLNQKVFLKGECKNVMSKIFDAEVFVMTSNFEGFPNVLIEAMATGLPVVSTNFPTGIAEKYIIDNINGFVVDVGDKQSLIKSVKKVISDPDLREIMSKNNIKLASQFDEDIIIKKWNSIFQSLLIEKKKNV